MGFPSVKKLMKRKENKNINTYDRMLIRTVKAITVYID